MEVQREDCPPAPQPEAPPLWDRRTGPVPTPTEQPPVPTAPPVPVIEPTLKSIQSEIEKIPGIEKFDSYLFDDRGITAQNSTLDIDVLERLGRSAIAGYIIADSATIKLDINNKGNPVTLFTGETFTLRAPDPFRVHRLRVTSASVTAGVRIFLI